MAIAGKKTRVYVSPNDTTYSLVADINDSGLTLNGENLDITAFGDEWKKRLQGLKDGKWDISGFHNPGDTNGQKAIQNALINDTDLYMKILFDGTNGFKQKVLVSEFSPKAGVDKDVAISISAEGDGAVTIIP